MSYIKSAVILEGVARIVEVHGATWFYLDIQAHARREARRNQELAEQYKSDRVNSAYYNRMADDYEKVAKDPKSIRSGLARNILERNLSPISNTNKQGWAKFAMEEDMPDWAPLSQRDRPPAVMVDLDGNKLADTPDNTYAEYRLFLPEGWSYERWEPERMVEFLYPRLPEFDRSRLGSVKQKNDGGE